MAQDANKAIPRALCISGLVTTLLLSTALTTPAFAGGGTSWSDMANYAYGGDDATMPWGRGDDGGDGFLVDNPGHASGGGGGGAGASGGDGGMGHDGVTAGGAGGVGSSANGGNGVTDSDGYGSGGGGGAHGYVPGNGLLPQYSTTGGNGGAGGAASTTYGYSGAAGGGGAGGYGAAVQLTANASQWSNVALTGGKGGAGGDGLFGARGGDGGSGGTGLALYNPLSAGSYPAFFIEGTVTGGNGGDGGANGGYGGNGGAGITVDQWETSDPATVRLIITGAVTGGSGGAAGSNGGFAGLGGVGLEGSSLAITMFDGGSIAGGMSGDPQMRANAINFTGGINGLSFAGATSQLSGNINVAKDATLGLDSYLADGTEVDNVITGGGSVVVFGENIITLTGANIYSGGTLVGGMLRLSAAGTLGDAIGSTDIYFGGIVDLGGTTQTQDTVYLGRFSSEGTIRNGNLNAAISSAGGTIEKIGGTASLTTTEGTTKVLGTNSYSGATVVNGGRLKVQGAITGTSSVDVNDGGILGGIGVINAPVVRINDGGIVGLGNSTGALTINGDLAQVAGSTFQVDLTSGLADRMNVSGTATIEEGALLNVVKLDNGPYVPGKHYTVLQADDGVSGTYILTGDTAVSAFMGLVGNYDPTHVYLDVEQNKTFTDVALTPNQRATGAGAESLGSGNALYDAILMSSTEAVARHAFDQLSGDVHASAKSVMIEDSRFARDAAMDRLRDAFDAVGAVRSPVTTYVDGKPVLAAASTDGFAFWGRGFGSWGQWDGDGNAATIKRDIGGFFAGGDGIVADNWRVGVLGGYSRSTFNVRDRYAAGSSDNYHVGLYGGTQWGDLAFRSGAAYTWHKVSTDRVVAFPGFVDSLNADYNARTAQAFGEFGYGIQAGGVAFEPFANLAYVSLATDGFGEKGGAAALTSASSTTNATFTTLGARAATSFSLGATTATAKGTLGWRHAYGDVTPVSQMRFAGGDVFSVAGVPIARNVGVVEAGLDFALSPSAVLGVSYGGQFGSGLSDQSVKANFNVKF
ncbi:outer membrane autotransporter protein [Mesorhizobium soli]|uniref:autotransporter outer membrane beta-barrel domain-containing protein n=1 Tax=Pseudaminobacter soli (ex Li et al. 2025) TaxID=1295366 RepID=UPI0024737F27|nr:autotransporter domain-containing protein [Mesorhizobium soli]MDH6232356.1 outer membrane autotransporter protein [Mesorhizobium soli]